MITVNVKGIEKMVSLSQRFIGFEDKVKSIVIEELEYYADSIRNDPEVPKEYADAIYIAIVEEFDVIALAVHIPERMAYERFGNRVQWAVYKCPRRKYNDGMITKEYDGPHFIRTKWNDYKATFINNVKSKIIQEIKSGA